MNEYRELREHECVRKLHAKVGDLFHDGTKVLDAVGIAHAGIAHDIVSHGITRDLVDPMLVSSDQRPTAEDLVLRVGKIIKRADDNVSSYDKPSSSAYRRISKQANTKSRSSRKTPTSTSQKTAPPSDASEEGVSKATEWVWDYVPQYRLHEQILNSFLRELFGAYDFFIEVRNLHCSP